eukprot:SAG31_NODE_30044_length_386_cov_0.721254_1_plen_55_part_10
MDSTQAGGRMEALGTDVPHSTKHSADEQGSEHSYYTSEYYSDESEDSMATVAENT